MVVWMAYAVMVAGLLGGAARVGELALRGRDRAARHAWTAALTLSLALPAWALLPSAREPGPAAGGGPLPMFLVTQGAAAVPTLAARLEQAAPWLLAAWLAASVLLAGAVFGGLIRLGRRARGWPITRVGEAQIVVSDDFGPALLGVRAPRVVLPRWTLRLDPEQVRMVVLHEEEHRRAGDGHLLLAATLAAILAPWNPALWWQLRRLRAAVELDCDARVVRRGVSRRTYGRLLLELGSRSTGLPFPVAALSTSRSLLGRRLHMIVRHRKKRGVVSTALAASAVVTLAVAACEAPAPTAVRPTGGGEVGGAAEVSPAGSVHALVADATGGEPWVFVDGERALEGVPAALDPADVDRIEVVKGPAAVLLYGGGASDGVVQIFTKAAGADAGTTDTLRTDSLPADTLSADVTVYVDGERFEGDVSSLDPESIARVDVVKGAAAGAAGAIVRVVTKKAARGGGE
jgi:hypothetical protein